MWRLSATYLNQNCLCQLIIDIISSILDGNHTSASAAGDHSDGLATVAAQGKQKAVQLLVVGLDLPNNIFYSDLRFR